ncbi:zinc-binding dehydrogenase [Streptomyces sp. NPDC001351]|uniref:zinc-binding dehydrogenase n=1 Tax=Streptomyces sp. NPDC001351 TaxID=3364564 RepID=UPI0036753247
MAVRLRAGPGRPPRPRDRALSRKAHRCRSRLDLSYAHPRPPADDLRTLAEMVAADRLHPTLSLVEDWTKLDDALAALRDRRIDGKAVLTL